MEKWKMDKKGLVGTVGWRTGNRREKSECEEKLLGTGGKKICETQTGGSVRKVTL